MAGNDDTRDSSESSGSEQAVGSRKSSDYWIGIDLGGTKMLAVLYDDRFEPLARRRKRTRGHEGAEVGVERIVGLIEDVLERGDVSADQISGIGVGCPSPIDMTAGVVVEAVNLGWRNVPLAGRLAERFARPVAVVNDVDAGTYAEYRFGAGRGAQNLLGVFPGTGIGGGAVVGGRILFGQRSCMEIGHIRVQPQGPLCGCGRYGCLESVASRLAISAEVAKAAYRGAAPTVMAQTGTTVSDIRSGVLRKAIDAGDSTVESIVRRAARWIGVAVADCVHLMAFDRVVLGGGLVEAMPELFVAEVADSANEHVMSPYRGTFAVVAAELEDDSAVRGAAAWVAFGGLASPAASCGGDEPSQ